MANTLKIKRGTAATIPQGQLAEPLFTTDTYDLYIGKGSGGNQRIQNYIASGTSSQFLKGDGSLDSTTYQATSEKGQNNGYASLDAGGKIPASQLPSSVIEYKGTWNASTNTPTLADGTGDAGDVYIVSVGGTQNLGSGSITFDAGDWVMYNGSVWQKSVGSNAVASVNGQTGVVSIGVNDLDDATITSPSNGQLLQYSTGTNKWVNWTPNYITGNQTITLSGDVSGSGATSITTTIGANKVTNSMLAQVASGSFLGRVTASTGDVETLTGTQATTLLDTFTSSLKGLTPASGGGTTNFLRADGTWAAPSGTGGMAIGGSITSATQGSVLFAGASGVLAQDNSNLFWDDTNNRLGIGTSPNTSTLHVNGDIRIQNAGSSIDGYSGGFIDYASDALILRGQATTGGSISLRTSANGAANVSTERVNIASNGRVTFTSSVTAASAIARGINMTPTLVAAANNDVLVGLDIAPTFTNGIFTGVTNTALRVTGNVSVISATAAIMTLEGNTGNSKNIYFRSTGNAENSIRLYQDGSTNDFLIATGNGSVAPTNRLIISSAGNVGINTTTVGSRLQVNGNAAIGYSASTAAPTNGLAVAGAATFSSSVTATNTIQSNDQNAFWLFQAGNTTDTKYWAIQNLVTSGTFRIRALNDLVTNGINAIEISRSGISSVTTAFMGGNVGINTTTIGSRLQVNGNAAIGYSASTAAPTNGLAVAGNVGIGTTSPGNKLEVVGDIYAQGGSVILEGRLTGGGGILSKMDIYSSSNASGTEPIRFLTANAERMRITSGGNLLFAGNQTIGINTADGSDNKYLAIAAGGDSSTTRGATIYLSGNERTGAEGLLSLYAGNASGGNITFHTGADAERMRITSGGEVLINTTSDAGDYKLQVNGNTYTAGTITTHAPAASSIGTAWKLGGFTSTTVSAVTTGYILVEVGGTTYYLGLVNPL